MTEEERKAARERAARLMREKLRALYGGPTPPAPEPPP